MVWLCKNGHKQKKMKIDKDSCKCKECGAKMVEDEMFACGAVKMMFNFEEETRMVCPNSCSCEYIIKGGIK